MDENNDTETWKRLQLMRLNRLRLLPERIPESASEKIESTGYRRVMWISEGKAITLSLPEIGQDGEPAWSYHSAVLVHELNVGNWDAFFMLLNAVWAEMVDMLTRYQLVGDIGSA